MCLSKKSYYIIQAHTLSTLSNIRRQRRSLPFLQSLGELCHHICALSQPIEVQADMLSPPTLQLGPLDDEGLPHSAYCLSSGGRGGGGGGGGIGQGV